MATAGAQRLLRRPQALPPAAWLHDQQIREIETAGCQRRRIGHVRRRDPDGALACAGQVSERRQKDRELADAGLVSEDFRQSVAGPAAAGELVVELGEAAG